MRNKVNQLTFKMIIRAYCVYIKQKSDLFNDIYVEFTNGRAVVKQENTNQRPY